MSKETAVVTQEVLAGSHLDVTSLYMRRMAQVNEAA
jgi:hypothetical protein